MERRNSPEATQSGLLASWRHKPWLMLGIGYYFAFSLSVVINCPSLIVGQEWFYSMLLVRGSFSATISISLIVMMFLIRKIDILGSGRWAIAFFVGLTSIGTILLILALNYVDSVELMLTSTLLIGIGNSVLLLSWGALFQKLSLNRLAGHVTLSCLFAAVACVAIRALPPAAYFAVAVTLPLASGITLILCADEQHKAEEPEVMWENGLTKILVCCIIMGLTCGLLRVFPVFSETFALHADAIYASIVLIFVLNANRPEVRDAESAAAYLRSIEAVTGLTCSGLVNNTHLCGETTPAEIRKGAALAQEVSRQTEIPILCHTAERRFLESLSDLGEPVFPIAINMKKPWER